ncbi:UPF0764 protein C16orf89 homolog [Babylonia areolata]|uniref:UPF0764 protein C16orf89 homolog n=1 Tax=Babylonia areolata TaxID=304850 RepID=UPI003FCFB88C
MPRSRHGRFQRGFLLCLLPLLALLTLPTGPAEAAHVQQEVRHVPRRTTLTYLRRTLQALEDALSFFHSQHASVNLDGVIGTRMVEGTLKVLLTNLRKRNQLVQLPGDLAVDIQSVRDLAKVVSDKAEPHVAINEPAYFDRIWPTIHEGVWELDYPARNLSSSVITWPYRHLEHMEEMESDDCLTELFGTSGKANETCVISDSCWDKMTKLGYHMYSLTHQIFYLQLAERSGCLSEIQVKIRNKSQPGLRELQDTFCANILLEAERLVQHGYPVNARDLFMEQAGLCGMYGYWQFFRYSWLDRILGWQDTEAGCYRNGNWPYYLDEHRRTKREELRLANGCLSHMTTVAASALVQYVRYLTEDYLHSLAQLHVPHLYWD